MLGIGTQCGALGTAAYRTAHMAQRDTLVTARNRKLGNSGQLLLHTVYRLLKRRCGIRREWGDLILATFTYGQQSRYGHQLRLDTTQLGNTTGKALDTRKLIGQQSRKSRQFIDRTVCLDSGIALGYTLTSNERCSSTITCFRIYFHNLNFCFGR